MSALRVSRAQLTLQEIPLHRCKGRDVLMDVCRGRKSSNLLSGTPALRKHSKTSKKRRCNSGSISPTICAWSCFRKHSVSPGSFSLVSSRQPDASLYAHGFSEWSGWSKRIRSSYRKTTSHPSFQRTLSGKRIISCLRKHSLDYYPLVSFHVSSSS